MVRDRSDHLIKINKGLLQKEIHEGDHYFTCD